MSNRAGTAVSLGGACDTLTCIAGSIAEGFCDVPEELNQQCREQLPKNWLNEKVCVFGDSEASSITQQA